VHRARADVTDDLTQQTFIRLWRAMQQGVRFQTEAHARRFLYAVAVNLVRDQWRSDQHRAEVPLPSSVEDDGTPAWHEPCADDGDDEARETLLDVAQVLATMPERDRMLLVAQACGYGHETLAAQYARSVSGIKNRIARARSALRGRYAEDCGESAHSSS
jgi:RNA polymerase sigma factor (sigma-70 family)